MAEAATQIPMKSEAKTEMRPAGSGGGHFGRPFESLHRRIDRLFDDFGSGPWGFPFPTQMFEAPAPQRQDSWLNSPAVDVVETAKAYEITADMPGMDEKNVEVKLANGVLTIKGEKRDTREEKQKDYYLRERSYGSFERRFSVPEDVAADKIAASFQKGVLTLTLPKKPEAVQPEKKIEIKPA